jgi:PAS domain S-box-containing protein
MKRIRRISHQGHTKKGVEQEYSHFFALSFDILCTVGFDGHFKRLSSACEKILGFSPTELLGTPLLEFVHPDDRAATIAVIQKLIAGERIDNFENRYRCKEGSYKWLAWNGLAVIEAELIYCTARDITTEKQTEETLQQSKQHDEALIHSLNGIVWEFDLQTQQFLFVSQKAEDILGYPVKQWLTEANFWENHIHPDDRERVLNDCHQFVLQRQEGQLEYRMIAADGSIVWVHDIISLVMEAEQPTKLRGVLIDITGLQQAKEILHRREQEFRALVENSPDVIIRIDRNFRYLYANPQIESRTRITAAEHIGKTSQELGFPDDLVMLWHSTAQRVFDTRQEQWAEFGIDSPSGHIFNHSRMAPEFAADGSVESVLIVVRDITEHKQLETALQESEARFRAFMQYSPSPAWITGTDDILLYANPTYLDRLRFLTEAAIIGNSLFNIFPPDQAQQYSESNNWVVQSNQVFKAVEPAIQTDGAPGQFLVYKFPIPTASEQWVVGGMAVDITEIKQIEAALQQSEARYRMLASHFPNGVVLLFDRNLRFVLADGTGLGELGLSKTEVEGKTIWEVLPPETCELVEPFYRAALEGKASVAEVHLANQVYLAHYLPVQAEDEQFAAGLVMTQNITERKQAEADLRESEERFRQIAETIHEVFWVTDVDFAQLFYISPAYEKIWGRTCQSLYEQPKSFIEAVYPEDKSQVLAVLEQQRQTGFSHEYRIVQPNGSIRWIWEKAFTVNDSAGNPYRLVGVSQDITDRKQAEEALKLADFSFDRSAFAAIWIGSDARILRVNEGSCQMLGYSRQELESKYVYELDPNVPQTGWSEHWQLLQQQKTMTFISQLQRKDGSLVPIEATLNYLKFDGKEYNFAFARDISERRQTEADLRYQREQEQLIVTIAQQVRQSLKLEEVLGKTVTTVRAFLKSDRVIIYRLDADGSGCIIAESVDTRWSTTLGTVITDCYFAETYAQLYQQGRVQAIEDIYTAELTACHVDLLAHLQVRANLAVPIAQEDRLWGLLVVQQCSDSRQWQPLEVNLLKQLATQVAIAIQQSELYQQAQAEIAQRQRAEIALRQQAERERLLAATAQRIRQFLDLNYVLDTTVTEVRHLLQADRVLLYWVNPDGPSRVITESVVSEYSAILDQPLPPEIFPKDCHQLYQQGRIRKIIDVETDEMAPCLAVTLKQFEVRSKLVVPILQGENLWGLLIAHQCSAPREWQDQEVDLLQQLSTQVAIAIQQSELYQQVQQLNTNLEIQVQERTLELQQALEFEALLKRITDKVRDSLDEAQILQTAVEELAIGLKVRCCDSALYDFEQGSSIIHFEYITSGMPPAKGQTFSFSNLPGVYDQLLQGHYVQFTTIAVPDFWRGGIAPQFTILSCPLMDDQGVLGDLWLFRLGEESFNALEVRLVEQVANHCAIALRQSRLYQAAQTQVIELERLNRLKDDFLSTVSHELRSPMSNIKMATQMLEVRLQPLGLFEDTSGAVNRYFQILKDECQREIGLINDLLDLARLDAGTEPLNLSAIDLKSVLLQIAEPFQERMQNQQQHFEMQLPPTLPLLVSDRSYLDRILTELLQNACKYTPMGEQIRIVAETILTADAVSEKSKESEESEESEEPEVHPSIQLHISNSGVEITEVEQTRIFDRFYRIPKHDPWKHGGTGLGLALVQKLIEQLQGQITVNSCSGWTTFTLILPAMRTSIENIEAID